MRSHTGSFMTMVTEGAYVKYSKQIFSTNISTETNIVGVDYVLAQGICTQYFLKEQGYEINDNVIHQDNLSAIKLENNDRSSSIKRKIHINIRYYSISYRIKSRRHMRNYVPPWTLLGIISRRHYSNTNSVDFVISFLVSMNMIFRPIIHAEEHCLKSRM